ncbi:MAG TPA: hypothetical protein PLM29_03425 [Deltaproteobacteria bacterium]|nr:hypothetical protein [Deltaproteobacteria bacterium]
MNRFGPKEEWIGRRVTTVHDHGRKGTVVGCNEHCVIIDYDDLSLYEHEPYRNIILIERDDAAV